ncbi:hypothetical protein NMS32_002411 [Vibrio alginolyticus]|nr:hypothetical protein [Vibrio alginolyticus]
MSIKQRIAALEKRKAALELMLSDGEDFHIRAYGSDGEVYEADLDHGYIAVMHGIIIGQIDTLEAQIEDLEQLKG